MNWLELTGRPLKRARNRCSNFLMEKLAPLIGNISMIQRNDGIGLTAQIVTVEHMDGTSEEAIPELRAILPWTVVAKAVKYSSDKDEPTEYTCEISDENLLKIAEWCTERCSTPSN